MEGLWGELGTLLGPLGGCFGLFFRCFCGSKWEVLSRRVLGCFSERFDRRKTEFGLRQTQFYAKMLLLISVAFLVPKSLQNDAFWATSALSWASFSDVFGALFWARRLPRPKGSQDAPKGPPRRPK